MSAFFNETLAVEGMLCGLASVSDVCEAAASLASKMQLERARLPAGVSVGPVKFREWRTRWLVFLSGLEDPEMRRALEVHSFAGLLDESGTGRASALSLVPFACEPPEECPACFSSSSVFYSTSACEHRFCAGCWTDYVSSRIGSAEAATVLRCMVDDCFSEISDGSIRQFANAEALEKYTAWPQASASHAAVAELLSTRVARGDVPCALAAEPVLFYHYTLCGEADCGWGCAYRCAQTVLANVVARNLAQTSLAPRAAGGAWCVPSLLELQYELVLAGQLTAKSIGSQDWIEPPHIAGLLATLYGVSGSEQFVHEPGQSVSALASRLAAHFAARGTPVVIDDKLMAYVLAGARTGADGSSEVLQLNPHFRQRLTPATAEAHPYAISWTPLEALLGAKRWMFLLP